MRLIHALGTLVIATVTGLCMPQSASAQEVRLGAHLGAIGISDKVRIGGGGHLLMLPYDTMGVMVDATFASFDGAGYFSSTPSVIFYAPTPEEFKLGVLAGLGFYKFGGMSVRFGTNVGLVADFNLSDIVAIGTQVRYHPVFDAPDVWNVFLTLSVRFGKSGW